MEQAATQTIYYLVAGGTVLVGAITAIILRIEARGKWKGEMEAHKSEMTEHKALVLNFMETINNRLIDIFDRLPPAVVAGSSPLRLTRLGETIAEELHPSRLISSMADAVGDQVSGMQPYDVQELCKYHIHEVFKPDEEQDAKIKACAFDHGLEDRQVLRRSGRIAARRIASAQRECAGSKAMSEFYCFQVIDGDTFDVSPNWAYGGTTGSRVRVAGVNAPELHDHGGMAATERLEQAVLGRNVVLCGRALSYGRLVAGVTVNGVDLTSQL